MVRKGGSCKVKKGLVSLKTSASLYVVHTPRIAEARRYRVCYGRASARIFRVFSGARHARNVETVAAPLFPRYVFVAFDIAVQQWRSIQSTIGVSRIVCNGYDPASVPEPVLEEIRRKEDETGFERLGVRRRISRGTKFVSLTVPSRMLRARQSVTDRDRGASSDGTAREQSPHPLLGLWVQRDCEARTL